MLTHERIAHQAGAALRRIRTDRGLAQRAVAGRAGNSPGRLSL
jgi:transcriptional regulator with XRE-family HTH domain